MSSCVRTSEVLIRPFPSATFLPKPWQISMSGRQHFWKGDGLSHKRAGPGQYGLVVPAPE